MWNGDKYSYNPKRFGELMSVLTKTLWKRMCMLIPKVSNDYKATLTLIESTMKVWINTFNEYKSFNWQNKNFPFSLSLKAYLDKI